MYFFEINDSTNASATIRDIAIKKVTELAFHFGKLGQKY